MSKKQITGKKNEKIITDKKILYLIRTLSRTKRKDYENYVINAIWNRLNDDTIEAVTQQYVHNPEKGNKHFIDLYFPALNIGIECDEAHHLGEENIKADKEREASIYDALHGINNEGYEPIHINVVKSYKEVQKQIDNAVASLKQKIKEKSPAKWEVMEPEEYYRKRTEITVKDKVGFTSINQACNILFSTNYVEKPGGAKRSYFTPNTFSKTKYNGYKVWFPKLAICDENGSLIAATPTGWINQLVNNGKEIIQSNIGIKLGSKGDKKRRIVFAKYKDPLGDNGYKFVGIFELKECKGGKEHYIRIEDTCTKV